MIKNTVVVGYVHPNIVMEGFARSLAETCLITDNKIVGLISASNPRQHVARNSVIENFLQGPGEWLMWIDTDMTFERDSIARLRATAKKYQADMVAGLAFIYKRQAGVIQPNAFKWDNEKQEFADIEDYTPGEVLHVDGTGSAFVLINRRVFEDTATKDWHQNWMHHPSNGGPMGHDLSFFYEACVEKGYSLVYDTGVKTGHTKFFELDEDSFRQYQENSK